MFKVFTPNRHSCVLRRKKASLLLKKAIAVFVALSLPAKDLLAATTSSTIMATGSSTQRPGCEGNSCSSSQSSPNSSTIALKDLIERALIATIKGEIQGSFDQVILQEVKELEKATSGIDRSNEKNDIFLDFIVNQLTSEFIERHQQDVLKKTMTLSQDSLMEWSRQVHQQLAGKFPSERAFFDQYQGGLSNLMGDAHQGLLSGEQLFTTIKSQIRQRVLLRSPKIREMLAKGRDAELDKNLTNARRMEGTRTELLMDGLDAKVTPVELIIPDSNFETLVQESPANLRMMKTIEFAKDFGAQTVLFNIPLYWVTLAHVGLDYSKNPRAISDFFNSLKDPASHVGFAAFIAANHKFSRAWMHMMDPRFHFLGPYLGMAMGLTASSMISSFWHDPTIQMCAQSHLKNKEACQKAYNGWVLSGKINELAPSIAGLIGTAVLSGLVTKGLVESGKLAGQGAGKVKASVAQHLSVRLQGMHILPKKIYQGARLEEYLLNLKKVKGLVNTSIVTIGSNLVFLAVDPFVSIPLEHKWQGMQQTSFNLAQFLELDTPLGNFENIGRLMMFDNIKLPHEISAKTLPQVYESLNISMEAFLRGNLNLIDPKLCLGDSTSMTDKQKAESLKGVSSPRQWTGGKNPEYEKLLQCLQKSDLPFWLGKYAEVEKDWRTHLVSESVNASLQWSSTIGDFLTMFNGTRQFYEFVIKNIWEHRRRVVEINKGSASDNEKKLQIAKDREALLARVFRRSELLKIAYEATKVPAVRASSEFITANGVSEKRVVVPGRSEEDQERFKDLYPSAMGGFRITELSDYLIASMACGPRAEDQPSAFQKMTSLRWLPWESVAALAPSVFSTTKITEAFSPVLQTAPGMAFEMVPPRITENNEACDPARWEKMDEAIVNRVSEISSVEKAPLKKVLREKAPQASQKVDGFMEGVVAAISQVSAGVVGAVSDEVRQNKYGQKVSQFIESTRRDEGEVWRDESAPIYWQKIRIGDKVYRGLIDYLVDHARVDILRPDDEFDHGFVDWYRRVVEDPIASENQGLWRDVQANYNTLLTKSFFPALQKRELKVACSDGTIRCGMTSSQYLRSQGVFESAAIELQTYVRFLGLIFEKSQSQQMSMQTSGNQGTTSHVSELRAMSAQFIRAAEALAVRAGTVDVTSLRESLEGYQSAYQNQLKSLGGGDGKVPADLNGVVARIFELMATLLTEMESYQNYTDALSLNKSHLDEKNGAQGIGNRVDPRARFSH